MAISPPRLHHSLLAEPANISRLRAVLTGFVAEHGADDELSSRMQLAVGEALNNVAMHAYRFGDCGQMEMLAHADEDGFGVAVSDTGIGFAPRPDSPGAGMGVMIMRQMATRVAIQPNLPDGGTLVVLWFDRQAPA
jgi:serine/threonine-protein kinase RsbW